MRPQAASVAHQAAGRGEFATDRSWHRMADRQCGELFLRLVKNASMPITSAPARSWARLQRPYQIRVRCWRAGYGFAARGRGPPPAVSFDWVSARGLVGIDEQAIDGRRRHQFTQQLHPLRPELSVKGHAGDVAARPVEAGDESRLDRVITAGEDDRNGGGRRLCRQGRSSAVRGDHSSPFAGPDRPPTLESIVLALRPAVFDRHVAALDVAGFA